VIISIESIIRIFKENNDPNEYAYRDQCQDCGCNVEITITKTSGGFGLKGGVLHEQNPRGIGALCDDCYAKSSCSETKPKAPFTDAA
jgi:hypothetical protein